MALTIGITGGSASGKTRFVRDLASIFSGQEVCFISQDDYYRDRNLQPRDIRGIENFDTPDSVDWQLLVNDLQKVKAGDSVTRKKYTYNNPDIPESFITFNPAPIIIAEGIFLFNFPEILAELDLKIFLEAKEHVKLIRRISRDKDERGYDLQDVLYRYEHHVAPNYERYILPFREEADIIIPNNRHYESALQVLTVYIKEKIHHDK